MININKIIFFVIILFFSFTKINAEIKDSLFATVDNKAITHSDIIKEIKIILILNGQTFSEQRREELEKIAIQTTLKRTIKQIEIDKYKSLEVNQNDLIKELEKISSNLEMDLDTLKSVFAANGIDFSDIEKQFETELLWNSLIFEIYKNRLIINVDEIEEELKSLEKKKKVKEYLLSEIIIKSVAKELLKQKIEEIKNQIETTGFENVAINQSISETSIKGGNLGWINENVITDEFKSKIINTPIGEVSDPIFLPTGILFLKVREVRELEQFQNLEQAKNQLVNAEKTKLLNMHSLSHYDKLRRSVSINYFE